MGKLWLLPFGYECDRANPLESPATTKEAALEIPAAPKSDLVSGIPSLSTANSNAPLLEFFKVRRPGLRGLRGLD